VIEISPAYRNETPVELSVNIQVRVSQEITHLELVRGRGMRSGAAIRDRTWAQVELAFLLAWPWYFVFNVKQCSMADCKIEASRICFLNVKKRLIQVSSSVEVGEFGKIQKRKAVTCLVLAFSTKMALGLRFFEVFRMHSCLKLGCINPYT
jgi:hypothetical protein